MLEDERKAEEAKGGTETSLVLTNDGTGVQDIGLLTELLEVIDSSLPLIGKTNAAKLAFAPDHESILLIRTSDDGQVRHEGGVAYPKTRILPLALTLTLSLTNGQVRRVLGGVVIKPHRARGFLEIAFCVVRKEEQRNGVGTRLLARLKEHALTLGVLHLLTYADDSATGFFEKSGFDPEHQARYMDMGWQAVCMGATGRVHAVSGWLHGVSGWLHGVAGWMHGATGWVHRARGWMHGVTASVPITRWACTSTASTGPSRTTSARSCASASSTPTAAPSTATTTRAACRLGSRRAASTRRRAQRETPAPRSGRRRTARRAARRQMRRVERPTRRATSSKCRLPHECDAAGRERGAGKVPCFVPRAGGGGHQGHQ